MSNKRALILVPCCKGKKEQTAAESIRSEASVNGIELLRQSLQAKLEATPNLATKRANRNGLLNGSAPKTLSHLLYQGPLFRPLAHLWNQEVVEILIVSAAYGLVKPREAIKNYELQMGDSLADGELIYQYWQRVGLADLLQSYLQSKEISHVWSLLPDSQLSKTQYHRVFSSFWRRAENAGQHCFWVKVYKADGHSAGTGSGVKRGEWLAEVLRTAPGILVDDHPAQTEFRGICGFQFHYEPCL